MQDLVSTIGDTTASVNGRYAYIDMVPGTSNSETCMKFTITESETEYPLPILASIQFGNATELVSHTVTEDSLDFTKVCEDLSDWAYELAPVIFHVEEPTTHEPVGHAQELLFFSKPASDFRLYQPSPWKVCASVRMTDGFNPKIRGEITYTALRNKANPITIETEQWSGVRAEYCMNFEGGDNLEGELGVVTAKVFGQLVYSEATMEVRTTPEGLVKVSGWRRGEGPFDMPEEWETDDEPSPWWDDDDYDENEEYEDDEEEEGDADDQEDEEEEEEDSLVVRM